MGVSNYGTIGEEIVVRDTRYSDIKQLVEIYINLSLEERRWFHPFPFNKMALRGIFSAMVCLRKLIPLAKLLYPRLVFLILVAERSPSDQIIGFVYLRGMSRGKTGLIANRGIISIPSTRSKGVGTKMDAKLIRIAREIGVGRFNVTVVKDNVKSMSYHHKIGYLDRGTSTEFYKGQVEEIISLEYVL